MSEKDEIVELGASGGKESGIHTVTIIGQIEGHFASEQSQKSTKYEHLIPLLVALEQSDDVKGILIVLNTMGGDVEAGLGIAEMIATMKKPTVSLVIGGSHSIGVPIAVAAKRSFITKSATMTKTWKRKKKSPKKKPKRKAPTKKFRKMRNSPKTKSGNLTGTNSRKNLPAFFCAGRFFLYKRNSL